MAVVLVSILVQDRVGLVSEIADHLFDAGVNLGDTTFAVLGSGAEFTARLRAAERACAGDPGARACAAPDARGSAGAGRPVHVRPEAG